MMSLQHKSFAACIKHLSYRRGRTLPFALIISANVHHTQCSMKLNGLRGGHIKQFINLYLPSTVAELEPCIAMHSYFNSSSVLYSD